MRRTKRRALCLVCLLCMALTMTQAGAMAVQMTYPATDAVLVNPYIGSVAWATSTKEHDQPFTLVYMDITWAELEAAKGVYDFEAVEKRTNLAHWRGAGKHVILRFVVDKPEDDAHMDIPQWLYDETGGDGVAYSIDYGRGYSPNYENEAFIQAHAQVIAALGERYGADPAIAYVQLGSLGHWGEWHVYGGLPPIPDEAVRERYVAPYVDAFPSAKLMLRRPFTHAQEHGAGLYNDTAGHLRSTEEWLRWIAEGGVYNETGEEDALVPMPDAWQTAPVGGELATSHAREDYVASDMIEQTQDLFARSHASWVGPRSWVDIEPGSDEEANMHAVLRQMGYRLRVGGAAFESGEAGGMLVTLTWHNDGNAPFYFGWQPTLLLRSEEGEESVIPLALALIDILPDAPVTVQAALAPADFPADSCAVYVGIVNPATGEPGVALAMETAVEDGWYLLAEVTID